MPEVILQVYPALGAEAEMEAKRPIGRNNEAYQSMVEGMIELCQAADELGYWGITHVEHHMHSEGMEISPAPILMNVHLGHYTKRLRHGQLGLVLPSHDPIRLAEEIAVADHFLKGRFFVGSVAVDTFRDAALVINRTTAEIVVQTHVPNLGELQCLTILACRVCY